MTSWILHFSQLLPPHLEHSHLAYLKLDHFDLLTNHRLKWQRYSRQTSNPHSYFPFSLGSYRHKTSLLMLIFMGCFSYFQFLIICLSWHILLLCLFLKWWLHFQFFNELLKKAWKCNWIFFVVFNSISMRKRLILIPVKFVLPIRIKTHFVQLSCLTRLFEFFKEVGRTSKKCRETSTLYGVKLKFQCPYLEGSKMKLSINLTSLIIIMIFSVVSLSSWYSANVL